MAALGHILYVIVVFSGLVCTVNAASEDGVCTEHDPGTISSCFDPVVGKIQFEINWSPQNLTSNQSYTIQLKKLVAPALDKPFNKGAAHVTVWIPGLPPDKPLYNKTTPFACEDILKQLPKEYQELAKLFCPFKGNYSLPEGLPIPFHYKIEDAIPVPQGSYHVRVEVYEDESPGPDDDILLCLDGWLIFADVTSGYLECNKQPKNEDNSLARFVAMLNQGDKTVGHDKL